MSKSESLSPCPIPDAHRRLMDCHVHWHAALNAYMNPDDFRLHLNSLIQALRNVTWLLQKRKADLPGFSEWYPEWQSSVSNDEVLSWIVRARNRIVKVSDLELNSTARVTVSLDWLFEKETTFDVPARWRARDIARMLLSKGVPPCPPGEGSLTVERRWIDRDLPKWELLEACAHAYNSITPVILRAHQACSVTTCSLSTRSPECITAALRAHLDCMWVDGNRSASFDLATHGELEMRRLSVGIEAKGVAAARERYGDPETILSGAGDALSQVRKAFETGAAVLRADGFIAQVAWLFKGNKIVDIQMPVYGDQAGKRLAMNTLALRVRTVGADSVLYLSEAWTRPTPSDDELRSGQYLPARKYPERGEAIQVNAFARDGRSISLTADFSRSEDGIEVAEPSINDKGNFMPFMASTLRVWGLDVPKFDADAFIAQRESGATEEQAE